MILTFDALYNTTFHDKSRDFYNINVFIKDGNKIIEKENVGIQNV